MLQWITLEKCHFTKLQYISRNRVAGPKESFIFNRHKAKIWSKGSTLKSKPEKK